MSSVGNITKVSEENFTGQKMFSYGHAKLNIFWLTQSSSDTLAMSPKLLNILTKSLCTMLLPGKMLHQSEFLGVIVNSIGNKVLLCCICECQTCITDSVLMISCKASHMLSLGSEVETPVYKQCSLASNYAASSANWCLTSLLNTEQCPYLDCVSCICPLLNLHKTTPILPSFLFSAVRNAWPNMRQSVGNATFTICFASMTTGARGSSFSRLSEQPCPVTRRWALSHVLANESHCKEVVDAWPFHHNPESVGQQPT